MDKSGKTMNKSFNSYGAGLMDGLSAQTRNAILAAGTHVRLHDGQLLQSRGTQNMGLGIVLQGHIRLMVIGVDGNALLSAIFGPGQQFNEVTLYAEAAQTHDVEAFGETELLVLTKAEFEHVSQRHHDILNALLMSNVQRVHQLIETLNDFRALPKAVVVARVLFKNARHLRGDSEVNSVDLDITQDDIAMFIGVTRAYLNKVLAKLSDHGLIELSYRKVRIRDIAALEQWILAHLTYDLVER